MANNKVQLADGTVLLDLTGDTVTPDKVLAGTTFHSANGVQNTGTAIGGTQVKVGGVAQTTWEATTKNDAVNLSVVNGMVCITYTT